MAWPGTFRHDVDHIKKIFAGTRSALASYLAIGWKSYHDQRSGLVACSGHAHHKKVARCGGSDRILALGISLAACLARVLLGAPYGSKERSSNQY
jgi:hypothetical protein